MSDTDRLLHLLTTGTGIFRTRNTSLDREAAERAREARDQVGLDYTGTPSDAIVHPTQTQCEARLGPEWSGKGVGELATWNYQYRDPVEAAANGLLGSAPHRRVLDDPAFRFWGAGIYTELPAGQDELQRRWYVVVWLSKGIPAAGTEPTFTDVPATHKFAADIEWAASLDIARGLPDGTYRPDATVTRGQMAAFLHRLHDELKP